MAKLKEIQPTNDSRTIITVISVIVALIAIVYAIIVKNNDATLNVTSMDVTESNYTESSDNPVVLEIDGQKVTRMEVMDNFAASGSTLPEGAEIEQVFPLLQDQYLVGALLKKAALDAGITPNSPEVALRLRGAVDQALRAEYIREMGQEELTENDLERAYEDIIANAPAMEERRARHILVESQDEAEELIAEINSGADFAELARENSTDPAAANGGDLGYFAKNEMVAPFADAAFALSVGSVTSEPVQTQFGWHVIKVEDSRTREKPEFEAVKGQLEQQLRQSVIAEKLQELRQDSTITVYSYAGEPMPDVTDATNAGNDAETAPSDATATEAPTPAPVAEPTEEPTTQQ